jgi:CheY-like chemotaxis protein
MTAAILRSDRLNSPADREPADKHPSLNQRTVGFLTARRTTPSTRVVQRHSAEVEIESTLGQGTTVRLIFTAPVAITLAPELVSASPIVLGQGILIVDDDPVVLNSLQDILEAEGHHVTIANGGQAGIEAFSAGVVCGKPFSIVITDLGIPYVDGRQVAAAVKKLAPKTAVVLFTGWGQRLVAEGDIPPHVDRVLSKPPKLRELRQALADCVALREAI